MNFPALLKRLGEYLGIFWSERSTLYFSRVRFSSDNGMFHHINVKRLSSNRCGFSKLG